MERIQVKLRHCALIQTTDCEYSIEVETQKPFFPISVLPHLFPSERKNCSRSFNGFLISHLLPVWPTEQNMDWLLLILFRKLAY